MVFVFLLRIALNNTKTLFVQYSFSGVFSLRNQGMILSLVHTISLNLNVKEQLVRCNNTLLRHLINPVLPAIETDTPSRVV